MRHTREELSQLQALPLSIKVRMTENRIREWVRQYGEDGVYVSFSGGKDSTVLMDIVRTRLGYDIPAVFVDVPTQYPELRDFAKTYDNVTVVGPKISFMEVCEKYGFPLISKEISGAVHGAKKYLTRTLERTSIDRPSRLVGLWAYVDFIGIDRRKDREKFQAMKRGIIPSEPVRYQMLMGTFKRKENGVYTDEVSKMYDKSRYRFLLDAPFEISDMCCKVMKKSPVHKYNKETGRVPITAQMASESRLRTQKWLEHGCNAFDQDRPISNPMSFWTEQDVLLYIKSNDLPICSVYGDVVSDDEESGQLDLKAMTGMELFDLGNVPLHTTGCDRTGCACCAFGAHLEKQNESRFLRLKESHPGMYGLLDKVKNNGVSYREAIEWTNEHLNRGHIWL